MTVKERLSKPDAQSLKQVWLKKANGWVFPAMHPGTIIRLHGEAEVIDAGTAKDGELVLKAHVVDSWHPLQKTR